MPPFYTGTFEQNSKLKNYFKGLLALIMLLSFGLAHGQIQTITYTPMTAAGYQFKYLKADSGFNIPNRDTSTGRGTVRGGSIVYDTTSRIFYGWNGIKWSPFGSGGGGGVNTIDSITIVNNNFCIYIGGVPSCITLNPDTVYVKDDLYVVWDSTGHQVIGRLQDNGLKSGGIVTKSNCWQIDVSPSIYVINHVQFAIGQMTLNVDTADATFPRIDLVIADSFGVISVLAGTPSATPVAPQINPASQIALTTIYIPAGALCLGIDVEVIYDGIADDPTQWGITTVNPMTVDFTNPDNPYHLNQAAFFSKYSANSEVVFTDSGPDTVTNGEILKMFIYLNGVPQSTPHIQFYNGASAVSQKVTISPWLNPLDTNQYQNISIPLSAIPFYSGVFNKLVVSFSGNDTSGAKGLYIDYVQLQKGLVPQVKTYVDSVTVIAGSDYYWKNGLPTLIGVRSSGTGTGHVYAGYGLTNVNDSTLRADTTLLLTKLGAVAIYQPIGITYQQVLTNGSTLTGSNTINNGGFNQTSFNGKNTFDSIAINAPPFVADSIWFSGTSITAGIGGISSTPYRFSTLVSNKLGALESNHGVGSGRITVEGINATNLGLIPTYSASKYRWMVTEWGPNDIGISLAVDTATFAAAYLRYIDTALARGWPANKILMLSPPYLGPIAYSGTVTTARQTLFQICAPTIAARRGIQYLNIYNIALAKGGATLLDPLDNIHPTNSGTSAIYANPIIAKLGDSVHAQAQALAVNGLVEVQKLKLRSTDTANNKTVVAGLDSAGNLVRFDRSGVILNAANLLQPQSASINIQGKAYIGNKANINPLDTLEALIVGSASVTQTGGGVKAAWFRANSGMPAGLRDTSVEIAMINGSTGYLQVYNRTSSVPLNLSFMPHGGLTYFGAQTAAGTNAFQFTGTGHFTNSLFVGGGATPTARLQLFNGITAPGGASFKLSYPRIATTAATGDGTTVTLTFAAQATAPFTNGHITVFGVTPAGYNGTFLVTGGTTTTVTYLSATTGAQTVAGTIVPVTLTTTPEDGAIERDSTHIYWSRGTGVNLARVQLDNVGSGTVTSVATASPITGGTITTTGTIGIDTTIVATRAYANNIVAGGGSFVALAGNTPLTGNWNAGAFNIESKQTAATATTFYEGFKLTNSTTASSGNQMYSPSIVYDAQGWKTTATAASQSVRFRQQVVPVQGTTNPTGNFNTDYSVNGAAYATAMTVNTAGRVLVAGVTDNGNTFQVFGTSSWGSGTEGRLTFSGNDAIIDAAKSGGGIIFRTNGSTTGMTIKSNQGIVFPATNTAGGTTGAQTINKTSGTVNLAAAQTSLVVTNSLVTTASIVFAVIRTNDANATSIKSVVPASGSFTINVNNAPAAEISIGFFVIN